MRIRVKATILSIVCLIGGASPALGGKDDWRPLDPALLSLKTPRVEKDADAEAIFWEVRVLDEVDGAGPVTTVSNYLRIKIFTERGRDRQGKVDITYLGNTRIKDIAGRTIKPDGTIVELKKDSIFDRTIVKTNGLKLQAKSFAMPAVEPGSVIEYRWREIRGDSISFYVRLPFQRDIPLQEVKYFIKPYSSPNFPWGMRVQTFHGDFKPFVKEKDGFHSITLANVPAFREEPLMPPEDQVRTWMLVYYSEDKNLTTEKYWPAVGKDSYNEYKSLIKVNDDIRKASAELTADAKSPEEKLHKLFDYCRSKVKNIYSDTSGFTEDDRKKMKENKSPADTLKRGAGTSRDIDSLFAALAIAAGFETRIARISDRGDIFFDPNFPDDYFLRVLDVAVKVNGEWRFFDVSSKYIPFGMLRWEQEGQQALICDSKEPAFVRTPLSPPEKSLEKRLATVRLDADGTLEGEVKIEYFGHRAVERKNFDDDDSPARREETLKDMMKERMSTADLTNIRIENVDDQEKPFTYSFHIRVPGYAQRTGKRLFVQPAFFQHSLSTLFPTSTRKTDVYFHYPWSEQDRVIIELPEGFTLDHADAPAPFQAGALSKYDVKVQVSTDGRTIFYHREFIFGGSGAIIFPVTNYGQLKQYFDAVHGNDNHTLTLKQETTASR